MSETDADPNTKEQSNAPGNLSEAGGLLLGAIKGLKPYEQEAIKKELCSAASGQPAASTEGGDAANVAETPPPAEPEPETPPPAEPGQNAGRRSRRRRQKKSAKKSKKGGRSRKNGSKNRRKHSRRR